MLNKKHKRINNLQISNGECQTEIDSSLTLQVIEHQLEIVRERKVFEEKEIQVEETLDEEENQQEIEGPPIQDDEEEVK